MRRISVLAVGTLGSVSPMAALGRALADAGYTVSVAAPENYRPLIEKLGLEYRRCGSDFNRFMKDGEIDALAGARTVRQVLSWRFPGSRARAMFDGVLRDAVAASEDADAIIFHPFVSIACDIAEAKNIPAILVPLSIVSPSAETPLSLLPRPTSPFWNRNGYGLLRFQRNAFNATITELRAKLGLGKAFRYKHPHFVGDVRVPAIYPVSPVLSPGNGAGHEDVHFTGYWSRDDEPDWQPSGALAEFLSRTPQPIYIGFGSMTGLDADRTRMLVKACEAAGVRAVLGRGWGSFEGISLSDNFHVLDYAPHQHLFPRVAAVVHHGGIGTVSSGLSAGRPTLVCPFMLDQTYWGHRVAELGAGPEPLPLSRWTPARLTQTICDLAENPTYRTNADAIGEAMRREDGLAAAVAIVHGIIGSARQEELVPPLLAPTPAAARAGQLGTA